MTSKKHLVTALTCILDIVKSHPTFCAEWVASKDIEKIAQVNGGDAADINMIAIIATEALEKSGGNEVLDDN